MPRIISFPLAFPEPQWVELPPFTRPSLGRRIWGNVLLQGSIAVLTILIVMLPVVVLSSVTNPVVAVAIYTAALAYVGYRAVTGGEADKSAYYKWCAAVRPILNSAGELMTRRIYPLEFFARSGQSIILSYSGEVGKLYETEVPDVWLRLSDLAEPSVQFTDYLDDLPGRYDHRNSSVISGAAITVREPFVILTPTLAALARLEKEI